MTLRLFITPMFGRNLDQLSKDWQESSNLEAGQEEKLSAVGTDDHVETSVGPHSDYGYTPWRGGAGGGRP